jgi:uncharacterized protein (TIGR03437 family)
VSNGVIITVAGGGSFIGDGGPATNAQLNYPGGIAVDSAGNLYIADTLNERVRKVSNGVITTVAGNGTAGFSGDGGPATSAELNDPIDVAVDPAGNLYIADHLNNRVRKVSNGIITSVVGEGTSAPLPPGFYPGQYPVGQIAVDSYGNLYFADLVSFGIAEVSNGVVTGVPGGYIDPPDGGGAIAVGPAGNLYFSAGNPGTVFEVWNGMPVAVAGNGNPVANNSGDGGPATSAGVESPSAIAVDPEGNLYFSVGVIRKVSNGVITTIPGISAAGSIAVDSAGNIYAVTGNSISLLTPSGPTCSASPTPLTLTPAAAGGNLSVTIQTTASCPWAVQDIPSSWIIYSGNGVGSGPATINLAVAANPGPARSAIISVAGTLISVDQPGAPGFPPPPSISLVQSAGQFGAFTSIAPGSWIEIYGSNLAPSILDWSNAFSGINAPTSLNGTTVTINGLPAYLDYVSPSQVNAQVPSIGIGPQQIMVTTAAGTSVPYDITVNATQPGLFAPQILNVGGVQYVGATFPDYTTYVLPTGAVAGITSRPASPGNTIYLFGIGFGPVTPNTPAGQIVQQDNLLNSTVQVTFGQTPATLTYAGLAPSFIGLYLFQVVVPNVSTSNAVPLTFTLGGVSGTQTLYTAVQD